MKNFLKNFLIFFIILEIVLFLLFFFDNEINSHDYFIYEFFILIYLNYYLGDEQKHLRINMDIIFKYFVILLKKPSFFFNYIINFFKKIFIFLFFYKYRHSLNFLKLLYKKHLYNYFVIWKPLFKKTSYFGYYRSNRSKWIK